MYAIAYDIGTTGVKSCLFRLDDALTMVGGEYVPYELYILENGGAEQDAEEWWEAMCLSTRRLLERTAVDPALIEGISFCSQMQGLVLVDREGNALRRPMSYLDQRASEEMRRTQAHGIRVAGVNAGILVKSLLATRAASTSVKDPLWKYKWVQAHEPRVYDKVYKWLDVKEYLICRLTGEFVMTPDTAFTTFLYDTRPENQGWSRDLCRMYGVDYRHLPRIIGCTDVAGPLREEQAAQLGLKAGTPVYGSGGDATLIGVGAGATELGDTHIYWGTSGWVGTVVDRQLVDIDALIAGIVSAQEGRYNYFAEMETAGKCFEWVKNHLALDEINIYLDKLDVAQSAEQEISSLYDYLSRVIGNTAPGAGGVIFTPWLHGNRCPFEDPNVAGMFFNIRLDTGKSEMLRAVIEGVCYHLRWMLECQDRKVKTSDTIRFVGGGALSPVTCQILADITGHAVETVELSKDVGAMGAALLVAVGSGRMGSVEEARGKVKVRERYTPDLTVKAIYERNYRVFRNLYKSNRQNFALLNQKEVVMGEPELREEVVDAGRRLLEEELVARTWGNVSCRLDENHMLITPSGRDYLSTLPEDLSVVDIRTGEWEGARKPSGERGIHMSAYQTFPEVRFVIHTHQNYASALTVAGFLDLEFTPSEEEFLGGIDKADYGLAGTATLREAVRRVMDRGAHTILMENHGVLVCASSRAEAFERVRLLEEICRRSVRGLREVDTARAEEYRERFLPLIRKACPGAVWATTPAVVQWSEGGRPLPVLLDDMAQMIGSPVGCCEPRVRAVKKALAQEPAVFLPGLGAVVRGQDGGDTEALVNLINKACITAIHAEALGASGNLSLFDQRLMRLVYTRKYARQKDGQ